MSKIIESTYVATYATKPYNVYRDNVNLSLIRFYVQISKLHFVYLYFMYVFYRLKVTVLQVKMKKIFDDKMCKVFVASTP